MASDPDCPGDGNKDGVVDTAAIANVTRIVRNWGKSSVYDFPKDGLYGGLTDSTDVTTAERKPDWDTIRVQLPAGTSRQPDSALVPGAMVFIGTNAPVRLDQYWRWWRFVPGANWCHPKGPDSNIDGEGDYPVAQISYEDAPAYAKWVGKHLPTEAEWELAARGGLEQADYVWGNELAPGGKKQASCWDAKQGAFPVVESETNVGAPGTPPVRTFPASAYGLYDMTGNVWNGARIGTGHFVQAEKVVQGAAFRDPVGPLDSYDPSDPETPADAPRKVIRGGSFLCNEEFVLLIVRVRSVGRIRLARCRISGFGW